MKNQIEQGAWRRAYVHPRKTLSLAAVDALRSTALKPNAISLISVNRP